MVEHALDFLLQGGRGDLQEPGAHGVLGPAHQVAQALPRKVDAQAEDLGQLVVVSGARDDAGIAGFREPRAGIVGEPPDHPNFAAVDDHVGDLLGQMGAAGNGEQVILSLGAGDLEQGVGGDAA